MYRWNETVRDREILVREQSPHAGRINVHSPELSAGVDVTVDVRNDDWIANRRSSMQEENACAQVLRLLAVRHLMHTTCNRSRWVTGQLCPFVFPRIACVYLNLLRESSSEANS